MVFWSPFPNHRATRLWKAKVKWHHRWQNHSWKPKKKRRWSHRASESFESWVNVRESTKFVWGSNLHLRGLKHIVSFHEIIYFWSYQSWFFLIFSQNILKGFRNYEQPIHPQGLTNGTRKWWFPKGISYLLFQVPIFRWTSRKKLQGV